MPGSDDVTVSICRWLNDAAFAYSMTYDEGTVDCLANALPVHEKFGFPGHVDVVVGQLGMPRDCYGSSMNGYLHMSADELKMLLGKGWGVGNHSWSHFIYPISPGLNLYREVVWSKYRLEDMIDHPVRIFTIPNDTYNYEPVIELVRQHYLACAYIEDAPNREGFDLLKIGNCIIGSGQVRPRPGWAEELKTDNLTLEFLMDSWLYETSHLCMWEVPQARKCITPEYLTRRFEKLLEISNGELWAATPDDVIDYVMMRRALSVEILGQSDSAVRFKLEGDWPVGVINSKLTFRIKGMKSGEMPNVEILEDVLPSASLRDAIDPPKHDGDDWLVSMDAVPGRIVELTAK